MKLYLPSGYLNVPAILENDYSIIIVVGGRGIGKTYGGLDYCYTHYKNEFIYLRRTPKVVRILTTYNPFATLNHDKGYNVIVKHGPEDTAEFYENGDKDRPVGLMLSLETFSDLRSAALEQYKLIFYDEFIPEPHRKKIMKEGLALHNLVETVNRNRELKGNTATKLFMTTNSDNIFASILYDLQLTDKLIKMQKRGQKILENPKRHLLLINCADNPISTLKADTVFYQFAGKDSEFSKVALNNVFVNIPKCIKSENLQQYNILYKVSDLYIYQHKFSGIYYLSKFAKGQPLEEYGTTDREITIFKRRHIELIAAFYNDEMLFEKTSYYTEFTNYLTLDQ